jgi:PhnB protein
MGLRQIDGHWRITHEHESVPFKMDGSFQAAFDLVRESENLWIFRTRARASDTTRIQP